MPAASGPRPPARPGAGGAPLVHIRDGAVPAPLVRALAAAVRALGAERLRDTYQTAFWYDLGPPACLAEEAALAVRPFALTLAGGRLAGAEWWLSRMRTSDVRVDFHQDRDEVLFARTGRTRHPAAGSVLFLNRCRGGLLAVTAQPADDAHPARAPLPLDADLVRPRAGRLALFPGDATHGVLDARGEVPHGRLSPPTPLRLALVMNWWRRRPQGRPAFDDAAVYRRLRR
jgi:hypothetical protein